MTKMINNLMLDQAGFKPVITEPITGRDAKDWHKRLKIRTWTRDEKTYSTEEALNIIEGE